MGIAKRLLKGAAGMGTETVQSGMTYVRKRVLTDLTKCVKRYPAQALISLTAAGFVIGFLAAKR